MAQHGLTIKARLKLYLSTDEIEGVFGEGKCRLLDAIRREGTLVAAARVLGRSYRKAWGDIRRAEQGLGRKLVERTRGGSQKGGTALTPFAASLVEAWKTYRAEILSGMEIAFEHHLADLIAGNSEVHAMSEENSEL